MQTDLRQATTAYVAPFVAFMIFTSLEGQAPQQLYPWVYTVKIAIVAGIWWRFRRWYPPATSDGWLLGLVAGIAGVAVWIALAAVPLQQFLPEALRGWIGGSRAAYNPLQAIENPAWAWGFIAVRMLGLAVVVPLMEEVFWRGFLLRYLIDEDFRSVPIGKLTPASFAIVTLAFTLVHPELLAAAVWCAGVNLLCHRTGSLWSCIIAHAVTNLLLGVYVLATGSWQLW